MGTLHTHTHTHRCLTTGFLEREIPVTNFDGVNNASAADFKASMWYEDRSLPPNSQSIRETLCSYKNFTCSLKVI